MVRDQAFAERYGVRYVELPELFADGRRGDAPRAAATLDAPHGQRDGAAVDEAVGASWSTRRAARSWTRRRWRRRCEEGWIAGAALDVFETEPLPTDSPLLALPNIMLTQHVAGVTWESMQAMTAMAVDSVAAVLRGEAPRTAVNPEAAR